MFRLPSRHVWTELGLGIAVAAMALVAYTRYSSRQLLNRDESIYVYAGQRLSHGVPPYQSIVDPKNPGTTLICGAASAIARLLGANDIALIRHVFLLIAVLTAVAMYDLGRVLWTSRVGGLVAAAVFISFRVWALDAPAGPDALMPGVLFAVVAMALAVRRRWLWAGVAAALSFIVWQPLLIYVAVVVVAAFVVQSGKRWRASGAALLGAIVPIGALAVYFAVVGALHEWIVAAFVQPPTVKTWIGLGPGLHRIVLVAGDYPGGLGTVGAVLYWAGTALVVVLAAARVMPPRPQPGDPLVAVVLPSLVLLFVFSIIDFLHYPHIYPLLPYPAIGVAGVVVLALRRAESRAWRTGTQGLVAVGVVALMAFSVVSFAQDPDDNHQLGRQRREACVLEKVLGRHGRLYALGDPTPLVLTHRVNPDRYIYFQGGELQWKLSHLRGGFRAWEHQIARARPTVVYFYSGLGEGIRTRMAAWLVPDFQPSWIGHWRVFVRRPLAHPLLTGETPPVTCGTTRFATVRSG